MKRNDLIMVGNVAIAEGGDTCVLEGYSVKEEDIRNFAGDLTSTISVTPLAVQSEVSADHHGEIPLGENIRDAYLLIKSIKG